MFTMFVKSQNTENKINLKKFRTSLRSANFLNHKYDVYNRFVKSQNTENKINLKKKFAPRSARQNYF